MAEEQRTAIPENVYTLMMTEAVQAQSQHTTEINTNVSHTNNLMRTKVIDGISTLDPITARGVDKILQQPSSP